MRLQWSMNTAWREWRRFEGNLANILTVIMASPFRPDRCGLTRPCCRLIDRANGGVLVRPQKHTVDTGNVRKTMSPSPTPDFPRKRGGTREEFLPTPLPLIFPSNPLNEGKICANLSAMPNSIRDRYAFQPQTVDPRLCTFNFPLFTFDLETMPTGRSMPTPGHTFLAQITGKGWAHGHGRPPFSLKMWA